jgi:hypothetical protein
MTIGDDDEEFDADDVDAVTTLAADLRARGLTADANQVADLAMQMGEEDDDRPAIHTAGDEILSRSGDYGELLVEEWGDDFHGKLARAEAALEDAPDAASAFASAVRRDDWQTAIDLLIDAERLSREYRIEPQNFNYSAEPAPPTASPTDRIQIQREIDRIYAEFPSGTREHSRPEVQHRLQALFARLHGEEPIVGRGMRTM